MNRTYDQTLTQIETLLDSLRGKTVPLGGRERLEKVASVLFELLRSTMGGTHPVSPNERIEELARQQGVRIPQNLEEISRRWPAETDPDELMDFVLTRRAEQREFSWQKRQKQFEAMDERDTP